VLFNSFTFLVFFPVVAAIYFALPHRWRWAWLLAASCYFYMAFIPVYILILFFTIAIDYVAGIMIESAEGRKRKLYLTASIVANVGVLAVFKYFNFLNANARAIAEVFHFPYDIRSLNFILPIGLSFHTFQAMSYTIEVYRGRQKAERHVGIYALYVMFFPQLVAGPIERPQNLLHQFYEEHFFEYERVANGIRRMAIGLFMKVVIADRLSRYVNAVYSDVSSYTGLTLIIATVFFAFQIYCDFAGYSMMAIGAAEVMGFKLMNNFDRPYLSRSISEFWSRWHISLSTWFRDYVYIPLGGNRVARGRWYYNLFMTFVLSGLWHGASWTFVIWGALNGFYLIFALVTKDVRSRITRATGLASAPRVHAVIKVLVTFTLSCIAWVFFRAPGIHAALHVFHGSLAMPRSAQLVPLSLRGVGITKFEFLYAVALIVGLVVVEVASTRTDLIRKFLAQPVWVRWPSYYVACMAIWILGVSGAARAFIYFQF
jgi:alginate O-acetyltransferase complex protein AlgI